MEINISDLKDQKEKTFKKKLLPNFLEIEEKELKFQDKIEISGKAYIASEYLIMAISLQTTYTMPCAICNEFKKFPIHLKKLHYSIEVKNIKDSIYDFTKEIRESIILEIPHTVECNNNCIERKNIAKHFKKQNNNFPFKDL